MQPQRSVCKYSQLAACTYVHGCVAVWIALGAATGRIGLSAYYAQPLAAFASPLLCEAFRQPCDRPSQGQARERDGATQHIASVQFACGTPVLNPRPSATILQHSRLHHTTPHHRHASARISTWWRFSSRGSAVSYIVWRSGLELYRGNAVPKAKAVDVHTHRHRHDTTARNKAVSVPLPVLLVLRPALCTIPIMSGTLLVYLVQVRTPAWSA